MGGIVVTVIDVRGDKVRLGITAPKDVPVHRKEVAEALSRLAAGEQGQAVPASPTPTP